MDKVLKDLRGMNMRDLTKKINNLEDEYFQLRCKNQTGQLADKSALKKARKSIARAKTILIERDSQTA